ncbi:MAG: lipoate--protein ligase family protein [Candidatus Altiarchaeales archaeon]|nr:lipoate--protein ligase family protein [Candidatus Altiarchaeales archaeon]MBD3416005.1 lipoate--protein ligase family protein [Candidatus Altiarchaeales archaeon]
MRGCEVKCRLLETGHNPGYWNMGLDEAVLEEVSQGNSPPTLRFYGWEPATVSIGYFQSLREEVDLDSCFEEGVDVVRRITGGGAVYHDTELTYSFISPEDTVPKDVLESYRLICSGLIGGFKELGIDAEFAPLNDIITGGRKISGNAQTRRMNCVLQHGTVLLDVDAERMFKLLRVSDEKMRDKAVKAVKERVTSVKHVLNREITFDKASTAFRKGFAKSLKLDLKKGRPTGEERMKAEALSENKYSTVDWNNKR